MKKFGKSRSGKKRKSIRFASCERRLNIVLDVTCENQRDFSAARRILDMQQPESSFFFICLLLFIYLSHFVYNLFSSIFFNLQRFKKFSFTRKLSNEVFLANEMKSNFINFPDNIISHTRRYY